MPGFSLSARHESRIWPLWDELHKRQGIECNLSLNKSSGRRIFLLVCFEVN